MTLLACGLLMGVWSLQSCKDDDTLLTGQPDWLGNSIYERLQDDGNYTTVLRLIDDLNQREVLSHTGSRTLFAATDSAFQAWYGHNDWGVSSYGQLSTAQKKLLLNNSMVKNAYLVELLSNVSGNPPMEGMCMRRETAVSIYDSVQILKPEQMPNTPAWQNFKQRRKSIPILKDETSAPMIHFLPAYLEYNKITLADLKVLTNGKAESLKEAWVNGRKVTGSGDESRKKVDYDVTCKNGYIHQMEDVLVPPGNIAQVLRKHDNTKYFSRIIDHYSKPVYDEWSTRQYNDWAKSQQDIGIAVPSIDSIFQVRYLSARSQDGKAYETEIGDNHGILNFDPGWNQYYPSSTAQNKVDNTITDLAAFFVPNDDAVKRFFLPGGSGSPLIDIYGSKRELGNAVINDEAHLMENLDSVQQNNPRLLTQFAKNLLKERFTATVPSKFDNITNDASENMGININSLSRKTDGKYDITFANNGVVYVINDMIVPALYNSVAAPAVIYDDMQVFGWAIQDWASQGKADPLGLDFNYYLLAMSANYAFFIPEDNAFGYYYLDPAS